LLVELAAADAGLLVERFTAALTGVDTAGVAACIATAGASGGLLRLVHAAMRHPARILEPSRRGQAAVRVMPHDLDRDEAVAKGAADGDGSENVRPTVRAPFAGPRWAA
jgi:hypothetical protein